MCARRAEPERAQTFMRRAHAISASHMLARSASSRVGCSTNYWPAARSIEAQKSFSFVEQGRRRTALARWTFIKETGVLVRAGDVAMTAAFVGQTSALGGEMSRATWAADSWPAERRAPVT